MTIRDEKYIDVMVRTGKIFKNPLMEGKKQDSNFEVMDPPTAPNHINWLLEVKYVTQKTNEKTCL